jgi:hypothetical protein
VQPLGRAREAARFRDGQEITQMTKFQSAPLQYGLATQRE